MVAVTHGHRDKRICTLHLLVDYVWCWHRLLFLIVCIWRWGQPNFLLNCSSRCCRSLYLRWGLLAKNLDSLVENFADHSYHIVILHVIEWIDVAHNKATRNSRRGVHGQGSGASCFDYFTLHPTPIQIEPFLRVPIATKFAPLQELLLELLNALNALLYVGHGWLFRSASNRLTLCRLIVVLQESFRSCRAIPNETYGAAATREKAMAKFRSAWDKVAE